MRQFKLVTILLIILLVYLFASCNGADERIIIEETEPVEGIKDRVIDEIEDQFKNEEDLSQVEINSNESEKQMDSTGVTGDDQSKAEDEGARLSQVEIWLSTLTLEERVGQLFVVDVATYNKGTIPAGGIIFFKHDISGAVETKELIDQYQLNQKLPLFIGIDEEGGLVSRITGKNSIGGTRLPNAQDLFKEYGLEGVKVATQIIINEISAMGFNLNFAPVADVNSNPSNPIIGTRAYSHIPYEVAEAIEAILATYEGTGVIPVMKHFPGHGDTKGDSHLEPVEIDRDFETLSDIELVPFVRGIDVGAKAIMMGHISLPEILGNKQPASLSKEVIRDVLGRQLGFDGMILSDSLLMESIASQYTYEEVIDIGLEAGLTVFLMPTEPELSYQYALKRAKEDERFLQLVNEALIKNIEVKVMIQRANEQLSRPDLEVIGSKEHKELLETLQKIE